MDTERNRLELLTAALKILKDICERREVFISLSPPFELSFEIDRDILDEHLRKTQLSNEIFIKQSNRIESRLLAVLERNEDKFIEFSIERLDLKGKEAEKESNILREEMESVRKALWNQHLQDRYDLKMSSKAPSFTSIDWDIKLKTKDAKLEKIRFPYATCRIAFQREFRASAYTLLGGRTFDTMQINFSSDEIEHLIKVLTTIRQYLKESEMEAEK